MYRIGLFVVFLSLLVCKVFCECTEEDFGKIKSRCKQSGLNFDMAETAENRTLVCGCLEKLFICINKTVPNCVDTMKDKYVAFSFTPWDCHILEHHTPGANANCGNDVIFEVRFKKEADDVDVVQLEDEHNIQESSDSCKIDVAITTPYTMFFMLSLLLWVNT